MSPILTTEEGCTELSSHNGQLSPTTFTESDYVEVQIKDIDDILNSLINDTVLTEKKEEVFHVLHNHLETLFKAEVALEL